MSYPNPVSRPGAHDQYPYPPQGPNSDGYNNSNANLNIRNEESYKTAEDVRQISRTPSPTPSEAKELTTGALDWKQIMNWRFWIRREWLCAFLFSILIQLAIVAHIWTISCRVLHYFDDHLGLDWPYDHLSRTNRELVTETCELAA